MAAAAGQNLNNFHSNIKNERDIMNKLRDSGMEYISRSGRFMSAKIQADEFCRCPQKCQEKLPSYKWKALFTQFYELADQNLQNQFLQNHIVIKSVHLHNWEFDKSYKRRVTCKYHVPYIEDDDHIKDFVKAKASTSVEICQKAFMNVFGITEKRVRMQREKCISKLAPNHYKNSVKKSEEVVLSSDDNNEISVVHDEEEPLDLSHRESTVSPSVTPPPAAKPEPFDKARLYEMAEKMGVSRETVDRELTERYEKFLQQNLRKQQRKRKRKVKKPFSDENQDCSKTGDEDEEMIPRVSGHVIGLHNDFPILPIQINNGDLTITPVIAPAERTVETQDLMVVKHFFQNQLWQPQYIGLSNSDKSFEV